MTEEQAQALSDFFETDSAARGARDAYATAVVMFVDDMLKMIRSFYSKIPEIEQTLTVRIDGIDLPTIFRHAANNVRHYLDWRVPPHQLQRPDQAVATATTIAVLMGKAVPTRENVSVWASNWAWPILHKISGATFDGLVRLLARCMDEMLENSGMSEHELVAADLEKYPLE